MEALKFAASGFNFYVLFSHGFSESREKMVAETGGDEQYCLDFLRDLSGASPHYRQLEMTEQQLKNEICYDFSFPERWVKEGANLALLGAWSYWVKGVITDASIAEAEEKLKAVKEL